MTPADKRKLYATINQLAVDPKTVKDAAILWLSVQLEQSLLKLAQIRAAMR